RAVGDYEQAALFEERRCRLDYSLVERAGRLRERAHDGGACARAAAHGETALRICRRRHHVGQRAAQGSRYDLRAQRRGLLLYLGATGQSRERETVARDGEEVRALVAEFVFQESRLVVEDLLSYLFERERARGRQSGVARASRANLVLDAVIVGLERAQFLLKLFERLRGLASAEAHARQLRGDLLLPVLILALLLK